MKLVVATGLVLLFEASALISPLSRSPSTLGRGGGAPLRIGRWVRTYAVDGAVEEAVAAIDEAVADRLIGVASHATAAASLAFFGLLSTSMMMPGADASKLASALTASLGPTSNQAFAAKFPTFVTPASYVFLVWPVITLLQATSLARSVAASLAKGKARRLSHDDLSALALANACASAWLLVSSNAVGAVAPLGSLLWLPLVPLFAGRRPAWKPNRCKIPPPWVFRNDFSGRFPPVVENSGSEDERSKNRGKRVRFDDSREF